MAEMTEVPTDEDGPALVEWEGKAAWARASTPADARLMAASWADSAAEALAALEDGASLCGKASWKASPCRHMDERTVLAFAIEWGTGPALAAAVEWAEAKGLWKSDATLDPREALAKAHGDWMMADAERGRLDVCQALHGAGVPAPDARMCFDLLDLLMRCRGRVPKAKPSDDAPKSWKSLAGGRTMADMVEPCVAWAVGAGLDPNATRGSFDPTLRMHGCSLLMRAGSGRVAKALLLAGADPLAMDQGGWTALAHAIDSGRKDWIVEIMAGGGDLLMCAKSLGDWRWVDAQSFASSNRRSKACEGALEGARSAISGAAPAPAAGAGPHPARRRL